MIEKQQSVVRNKAILKRKNTLNIGTWNIRLGIEQTNKREAIIKNIERRNADIVCIQESGCHEDLTISIQPYQLISPKNELGIIFKRKHNQSGYIL